MSKRLAILALALAAVLLWRRWSARRQHESIDVPGLGRVRLEPDKRKRDAWQAYYDRKAGDR